MVCGCGDDYGYLVWFLGCLNICVILFSLHNDANVRMVAIVLNILIGIFCIVYYFIYLSKYKNFKSSLSQKMIPTLYLSLKIFCCVFIAFQWMSTKLPKTYGEEYYPLLAIKDLSTSVAFVLC